MNKVEGRTGLIMELPPYHKPHWKSLFGSVFRKMGNVLSRALRIIICISVIFWLLSYSADGNVANSIIYKVGTFIEPVTSLFGLPWQLLIAFVASAMGKEASLGVMASLFNTGSIWAAIEQSATVDTAALSTSMLSVISRPEALAFLFAFFFNMPCLMALTATTQETHSMKWTVRIQLLEYLQSGKTYSVQELAELLHKDVGSIQVELEYLENQGYIRKVAYQADCNHNCNGCHGCDQPTPAAPDVNIWEVIKRTE